MPSLYESTVNTGEVSSSNFTTLYNASGLQVPNAGAGSVTGNLNVGGNLIVQGTSLLQGAVSLGSTLSTPNYTFPLPDGTTDQVLVTDGSGNLYWTDVSSIPGAAYQIQANTATGGANLTLLDSAGGTDSVKFAGGTNITVVRTDENTITINSSADDIPNGTAAGDLLVWDGSAWTANNQVTSLAAADRFTAEFKNTDTARGSSAIFLRNYASTAYTTGLPSAIAFSFDSDSQVTTTQGAMGSIYDAAKPSIFGSTSIDNFTNSIRVFDINSTDIGFNGTNLVLNNNFAGTTPSSNSVIGVERGTVEPNATITWNESTDRWEFSNTVYSAVNLAAAGNIAINRDASDDNAVIVFYKPTTGTETIAWNKTLNRFELSNNTEINGDLAVDGGDITTTATIGNLFNNDGVPVVNIGNGATTEVNLGSPLSGRVQVKSPLLEAQGNAIIAQDLTVNGGNINLNGVATPGTQPFITFATQPDGVNSQYGLRGYSTVDDPWFIGAGSAGDDQGYLEIATGDNIGGTNNGGQIYVRQYNGSAPLAGVPWFGGNGVVVNQLTLLDNVGNTTIPNSLTVDSGTLFVDAANNRVGVNTVTPGVDFQVGGTIWGTDIVALGTILGTNGNDIYFNFDDGGSGATSNLTVRRGSNPDVSVRWNETTDRWQTTTDGSTFLNIPNQNLDTNSDVTFASVTIDGGQTVIDTTTINSATTGQITLVTTSNATIRSSKFQIQITDNVTGNIHVLEAMLFYHDIAAYLTTYSEMYNSTSLATFAADNSGGVTRLLATPASTNSTTFRITRISVAA